MGSESHGEVVGEEQGIMDFSDALKKAGINIAEKPQKIEKDKQTVELKINGAYKILDKITLYADKYTGAPDTYEHMSAVDGLTLRFNEMAQFFIDIADVIYEYNNTKAIKTEQKSLGWAIRQIQAYVPLSKEQETCIQTFRLRNDVVHDYINSDIYKEEIADFFIGNNRVDSLKEIVNAINNYVESEKIK